MKYEVRISGKTRIVEVERDRNGWQTRLDGEPIKVDAVEIAPHTFSVLLPGESHEISITSDTNGKLLLQASRLEFSAEVVDPRSWSGRRHAGVVTEGRQQVVAPMPGKVVRVLVEAGQAVEASQGLLVVEAMKMQNEIRSPKSGKVERVLVLEGQAVHAGEVLCIIG